jgi:hypothetical protein
MFLDDQRVFNWYPVYSYQEGKFQVKGTEFYKKGTEKNCSEFARNQSIVRNLNFFKADYLVW